MLRIVICLWHIHTQEMKNQMNPYGLHWLHQIKIWILDLEWGYLYYYISLSSFTDCFPSGNLHPLALHFLYHHIPLEPRHANGRNCFLKGYPSLPSISHYIQHVFPDLHNGPVPLWVSIHNSDIILTLLLFWKHEGAGTLQSDILDQAELSRSEVTA